MPRGLLAGYVELKAPGVGREPRADSPATTASSGSGFQAIPNLIYCDGNDWGLYRNGEAGPPRCPVVRRRGDRRQEGRHRQGRPAVLGLLTDFLSWQPIIPKNVKDLAGLLAPLCRMLRDDVTDALKDPQSPLVQLAKDWRQLLFPDAERRAIRRRLRADRDLRPAAGPKRRG